MWCVNGLVTPRQSSPPQSYRPQSPSPPGACDWGSRAVHRCPQSSAVIAAACQTWMACDTVSRITLALDSPFPGLSPGLDLLEGDDMCHLTGHTRV